MVWPFKKKDLTKNVNEQVEKEYISFNNMDTRIAVKFVISHRCGTIYPTGTITFHYLQGKSILDISANKILKRDFKFYNIDFRFKSTSIELSIDDHRELKDVDNATIETITKIFMAHKEYNIAVNKAKLELGIELDNIYTILSNVKINRSNVNSSYDIGLCGYTKRGMLVDVSLKIYIILFYNSKNGKFEVFNFDSHTSKNLTNIRKGSFIEVIDKSNGTLKYTGILHSIQHDTLDSITGLKILTF